MHCFTRRLVSYLTFRLTVYSLLAVVGMSVQVQAANIAWTLTDFNTSNLDLSGNVLQAVNFGSTNENVTVGGNTATFVSSTTISPVNGGFPNGPNDTAAMDPMYTNTIGNAELTAVLMSHSWSTAATSHTLTLDGLIAGQGYRLQAFMSDVRTTGTTVPFGSRAFHLTDDNGNDTATVTRNSGTIFTGTFTADASTQAFSVIADDTSGVFGDPALSGYVLTLTSGGTVQATVNRATGQLTIANNTASPLDMIGYTVTSAYEGLSQTGWTTISNNYDKNSAPTPGNGSIDPDDAWTVLSDSASHIDLSEAELEGGNGGAIGAGQSLNLGNVWIKSPVEDVVVKLLRSDGAVFPVSVQFSGNGGEAFAVGDLNFNGALDPADWSIYLAGAHTDLSGKSLAEAYQAGDLNNNGVNNLDDMKTFIDAYNAANGIGAFQQMIASVPEPATCLPLVLGFVVLSIRRTMARIPLRCLGVFLVLGLIVATHPKSAVAAELFPIATSGHDADIIFENDGTPDQNEELGSRWFFEQGLFGNLPTEQGLPAGPNRTVSGFVSGVTGNTIDYAFNDYGANNVLMFEAGGAGKTLTLDSPAPYGQLAVVFSGGSLSADIANLDYTINYTGGATQAGIIDVPDWGNATLPTGVERLLVADRANTGPALEDNATAVRWAVFVSEITPSNPTASIESITFGANLTLNGGPAGLNSGDDVVVFGLAGPTPGIALTLDLEVDKASGQMSIKNPTQGDIDIQGYEILSETTGTLSTSGWTVPGGWEKAGGASNSALQAGALSSSYNLLAENGSAPLGLGTAYNTAIGGEDLAFRFLTSDGLIRTGSVSYMSGGLPGDFDQDGDVDGNDLSIWQTNYGSTTANNMTGDADGDGDADGRDFLTWQRNFTGPGASTASNIAVPEPSSFALFAAMIALIFCSRVSYSLRLVVPAFAACKLPLWGAVLCAMCLGSARADVFVDRQYRLGDDPQEDAANAVNDVVGSGPANVNATTTLDSAGTDLVGFTDFQDLVQSGDPVYVDVGPFGLARPDAPSGAFGIQFDGSNDYLRGIRLGYPSTTVSSTAGTGPNNYSGLSNRGFQLWVRPNSAGNGTAQDVVLDGDDHGLKITAAGTWAMRYNSADVNSGVAVNFDDWNHVMVVRPFGAVTPNGGSILYVNGVAVAASAGNYDVLNDLPLIVGADTGDGTIDPFGSANFFNGVLDDMTMFVSGRTVDGIDRGTFNLGTDNDFAASTLTGVPGDVDQSGSLTPDDVSDFLDGWMIEHTVNGVRVGDINTIANGDLNFDGITDLSDAFLLHGALLGEFGVGLDFSLLGSIAVPEPTTMGLGTMLAMAWLASGRKALL